MCLDVPFDMKPFTCEKCKQNIHFEEGILFDRTPFAEDATFVVICLNCYKQLRQL